MTMNIQRFFRSIDHVESADAKEKTASGIEKCDSQRAAAL
jgi:hypothetical protein